MILCVARDDDPVIVEVALMLHFVKVVTQIGEAYDVHEYAPDDDVTDMVIGNWHVESLGYYFDYTS
jgi:hypothetical protein